MARWVDAMNATDNTAAHAHASNVAVAIALAAGRRRADHAGRLPRQEPARAARPTSSARRCTAIENVCCLTGDDVTAGDEPEARRVFDLDGPQLDRASPPALAQGHYLSGRAIDPAPQPLRRRGRERCRPARSSTAPSARRRRSRPARASCSCRSATTRSGCEAFVAALDRRGLTPARRAAADDRARQGRRRRCASWTSSVPGIYGARRDDRAHRAGRRPGRGRLPSSRSSRRARRSRCRASAACT